MSKLIAGKTQIGHIKAKDNDNILLDFDVFYGNVLNPPINGTIGHLPIEAYNQMLTDFLNSDEGQEYDIPTEKEVLDANAEMLNRETKILNSVNKPSQDISNTQNVSSNPASAAPMQKTVQSDKSKSSEGEEIEETRTNNVNSAKNSNPPLDLPESEPDEDDQEEEDEELPEIKSMKKKIIPLIIVIAAQFICIVLLSSIILTRPTSNNTSTTLSADEDVQEEVQEETDVIKTESIIGKWEYNQTVIDCTELIAQKKAELDARKEELTQEEYDTELQVIEEMETYQTTIDENYVGSFYVFDDTGAFKTEGVKADLTVMDQVSKTEADTEGAYVLDEINKTLTLKANGTYLMQDVVYSYYVSNGMLSLTINSNQTVQHIQYNRVY